MKRIAYSLLLISILSSVDAAESTVIYDATYASWLSQSWATAGGVPFNGTLVAAEQTIEPGLIHRISYRNPDRIGLQPFLSVAGAPESKYLQGIAGINYRFYETWRLTTEVEYGSFNVETTMRDSVGNERSDEATSSYQAASISLGTDTWGGYFVMRRHQVPNIVTMRQEDRRIIDMYYDKEYAITTAMLGAYLRLGTDIAGGRATMELRGGLGPGFGTVGDDARQEIVADWGERPTDMRFGGFDASIDLGYERRIFGSGLIGFGVRAVAFGQTDAIDGGDGDHGGGATAVTSANCSLESTRMDGFWGPYLRIGAVF